MAAREVGHVPSRQGRAAAILAILPFLAILTCPVAGFLVVRHELAEAGAERDKARASAEAATEQLALDYAEAVIGLGDRDLSDDQLDRLAPDNRVVVHAVERGPTDAELLLVLMTSETYGGGLFAGRREVLVCYRLVFAGLGTEEAGYTLTRLDGCPPDD